MPDPAAFHAQIIESGARAIAAGAAERLLEAAPNAHAFGKPAFPAWHEHLTGRLLELVGAMRAGEPALFCGRLDWARLAFEARGLDTAELRESIDAIEHALREDLPPGGTDAIAPYLEAARDGLSRNADAEPPALSGAGPNGRLASGYMLALLEGDRRGAIALLESAVAKGMTAETVMLDVLIPVAREVGRQWHLGEVAIGEEHFVTNSAMLALGWLRGLMPQCEPDGRSVMIGAVPGNRHDLAGRIAGLILESAGFRVVDLGAETPAPDMVRAAGDFGVDGVLLGVMLGTQIESARHAIAQFRADERTAGVFIVVGGHVFDEAPELWERIGANGHARTIHEAGELLDRLIGSDA